MGRDNAAIVRDFVDEVITQGNIEAAAQYVWEQDGLCASGEWSSTAWRMAASRTPASSWILSA
jgi:hypothetical protein